ncbi:branched-chain amino acid aminotransferase/4-amino-4-deoxychorismate lyase [Desulfuromonas soudanensis]|uniref:branched-chain-amino-acid transaminase n=1 Tax=Desulfuromonas soudanensis TaxID=1603606 RepID=A0A0M4D876_9BACT|nr:aminotransferase class IV [Desulfuromonas soudanensis]ALC15842.1 branched-chain amino acid aminotransferase/4-amino-4-deoxychorismate lyase [Desulfuromonas soudanensis]
MIVNIDGRFVAEEEARISIFDGAVRFGDSLFETLKAKEGRIFFLEYHLDRIELSARLLGFPCDRAAARSALQESAARLGAPVARLRLTLTRGAGSGLSFPPAKEGRILVTALPYAEPTNDERLAGAACVLAPNRRVNPLSHLPQMKRGNYADCLYAADFARRRGAREALFIDEGNNVLEGATSNLFAVVDGTLVTPPAGELVLAGILRARVLAGARALGLPVREGEIPLERLYRAKEAFLANALIGTLPVSAIEGRPLKRGRWAEILMARLEADAPL